MRFIKENGYYIVSEERRILGRIAKATFWHFQPSDHWLFSISNMAEIISFINDIIKQDKDKEQQELAEKIYQRWWNSNVANDIEDILSWLVKNFDIKEL